MLDLHACSQSDVTSTERRGVFGDLWLSCVLQGWEEKSQYGWCVVSSFGPTPLSLSHWVRVLVSGVVCLPLICSAVEKFVFYIVLLFWSDQGYGLAEKLLFNYFNFLTNFIDVSLCADPMRRNPFFPFWKKSQHR